MSTCDDDMITTREESKESSKYNGMGKICVV
jgi:hypothetical protein